jgi:hypothetical protein
MKGGGICQPCAGTGKMMGSPRFVTFLLLTIGFILCLMVFSCMPPLVAPVNLIVASAI